MRFEGTRPSGADKEVDVYIFTIGKQEMQVLSGILEHVHKETPATIETMQFRHRVQNMVQRINAELRKIKANKK